MFGDRFFGARYFGNRYFGPVATGDQSVIGVHYTDPDTFGAAIVGRGAVNIAGVLYTNADTFGTHTISASYTVTGTLYSDGDTFGAATVSPGAYAITGLLYADADTFGTHVFSSTRNILAAWFNDPDTFGTSVVFTPLYEVVSPGHERCMRCGFVRPHSQMRREWTGLLVCEQTCWDPRHPQMALRGVADHQDLPWVRPEPEPVFVSPTATGADDL